MSLELRHHPLKGRGLYTTRLIRGGEVVLEEEPLLLLVAPDHAQSTCANCLKAIADSQSTSRRQSPIYAAPSPALMTYYADLYNMIPPVNLHMLPF